MKSKKSFLTIAIVLAITAMISLSACDSRITAKLTNPVLMSPRQFRQIQVKA